MGGANGTDDTATAVPLLNVVWQLPYHFLTWYSNVFICRTTFDQTSPIYLCYNLPVPNKHVIFLSTFCNFSSQWATRNAIQLMAQQAYMAERLHIATGLDTSKLIGL